MSSQIEPVNSRKVRTSRIAPQRIEDASYTHRCFHNGQCFPEKKTGRLPAMGWNSWNAFGSHNTEALTKAMADKMLELGLDHLGYRYLVLDDGCYRGERVDGRLANEPVKFPNGFRHLSDYLHERGLKFGMYNDIGTHLCAGSAVGTCGFEDVDARSYADWNIDFLKVDNCYYLWDNATFSNAENARYTYAPNIKGIRITADTFEQSLSCTDGVLTGRGGKLHPDGYITNIGTFDGTNVGATPVGEQSSELSFTITVPADGTYALHVTYATGKEAGVGEWLQVAVGSGENEVRSYDNLLPPTQSPVSFTESDAIPVQLLSGANVIRLMNHRRQENVLQSYAAMFYGLYQEAVGHDIILSICEWGKTQPQDWGYKVGDSWRILNDITFQVGSDGDPGKAAWTDPNTTSITSQYDKAVIMDEFAGLDRGWNDPDMLVIGMDGLTDTMNKTHMTMWCMMNSPLMLGLDLRRITKGDTIWNIIANPDVIALNQDPLGVPAKRVFCTLEADAPDKTYITNHDRVDILAKPLKNGDIALSFINLSDHTMSGLEISLETILDRIGSKMPCVKAWQDAKSFEIYDIWTKQVTISDAPHFSCDQLQAFDNQTIRISIKSQE